MRNDQLAVMLRDFARRANQWADVLEREYEDTGLGVGLKEVVHVLNLPDHPDSSPKPVTPFVTADMLQVPTSGKEAGDGDTRAARRDPIPSAPSASVSLPANHVSLPWRRGDYFFCEGCTQRRQWWKDSPPWRGAICATCYNAELARIEAARGKKA
jgi:hypothetical protein